jgi:cephalosporin hydroxylase
MQVHQGVGRKIRGFDSGNGDIVMSEKVVKTGPIAQFEAECREDIRQANADMGFLEKGRVWFEQSLRYNYPYHFLWMGIPIIQYPQDIMAMQELIYSVKPDLILETGIAHGGSLVFYASLLRLLGGGKVVGIDIDIRAHNREQLEKHPMAPFITMLEGSSIDPDIVRKARALANNAKNPLVVLDAMHTHEHVLAELRAYSSLVKENSYIVVCDTLIEHMPADFYPNRPWGAGNNPHTAVQAFMEENRRFEIDRSFEEKILFTCCPGGFLRCVASETTD